MAKAIDPLVETFLFDVNNAFVYELQGKEIDYLPDDSKLEYNENYCAWELTLPHYDKDFMVMFYIDPIAPDPTDALIEAEVWMDVTKENNLDKECRSILSDFYLKLVENQYIS